MDLKVAVVGPGGVGAYFGGMLARAGAQVTMIGRPGPLSAHLKAMARDGLRMKTVQFDETVAVSVDTDPAAVSKADLVLFSVKATDTETAAAMIAPHVGNRIVLDLQNGVDNPERMRSSGVDPIAAVVYVAAAIESPGTVTHRGGGDVIVGDANRPDVIAKIENWFGEAGIGCKVTDRIEEALWQKLITNSMGNAISALTDATYGAVAEFPPTWTIALDVARESVAVGRACGVELDLDTVIDRGLKTFQRVGAATSSTQADIANGRKTEIDSLNGYIARRGEELGIAVPVNAALWGLVKLREGLD